MIGATVTRRLSLPIPWTTLTFLGFWTWAIWSCAEHWRGNPNYSYGWVVPFLALLFGLRRYWIVRRTDRGESGSRPELTGPLRIGFAVVFSAVIFALEFARQQMWHPQIILVLICLSAVAFSFYVFRTSGGARLTRAEVFPVLFFFTAVPWPARFEQPITSTLMRWVSTGTTELLHWIGVEAQTIGGAIALGTGLVGITDACSGIRSLQAGIMFGLAVGEWFLLRPNRRVLLLAFSVALALVTNLGRTLALALQAEWHGVHSVEQAHDLIGNVAISTLVVGVWFAGKLLRARAAAGPLIPPGELTLEGREFVGRLFPKGEPAFAAILIAGLIGLISAQGVSAAIEWHDHSQTSPFFHVRVNAASGQRLLPVPKEIWNELRPTTGEYIGRKDAESSGGEADLYHFFWKPSAWNRFVGVHRPDICMPGVGWQSVGPPEPIDVDFNGRKLRCYVFRFWRENFHALQLWGVWRNGVSLPLDYPVLQLFDDAEPPPALRLGGKRRSATEIVSCSLIREHSTPEVETAQAFLRSVFEYQPR